MRSVGCIINDYFDRFIDKEVDRTSKRPLASGDVSFLEAILVMVPLLLFSLIILMYFNTFAIIITLASLPLVIMYPLMKRITYWPQLFLGLTFSWGVLIVAAQFQEFISIDSILLYIGCVFWTLGYDTIYSYQDRKDDIKIKLKSTAILFNDKGKFFVIFFYLMFAIFLFFSTSLKLIESKSLILLFFILGLLIYLIRWNINSSESCKKYFNSNNFIGLIVFVLLIFL